LASSPVSSTQAPLQFVKLALHAIEQALFEQTGCPRATVGHA
jgi:hypothetical protein